MLRRIYEQAAYESASIDGCYWLATQSDSAEYSALQGEARADFAIIGAGYTGLSAAHELAKAGADVAVLDLHRPGWGASGRNGGFCCMGSVMASRASLIRRHGHEDFLRYRRAERAAVAQVRQFIEDEKLDADLHSLAGEVQLAHRPSEMAQLREYAADIAEDHDVTPELVEAADLAARGMAGPGFHGGLIVPLGFALNPRKYVLGLAHAARRAGARIYGDCPVTHITRDDDCHVLETPAGRLRARNLLLATNGYSAENLPGWMRSRYLPVQSSVIVTRPLTDGELAAQGWHTDLMAYDTRRLLHYFRLMPDRRFLFGMRGGIAWTEATHAAIRREIMRDFHSLFPAWTNIDAPYFWSGLVSLTRNLTPYIGPIDDLPHAHAAFGYHGNGVAMASWAGQQMAKMTLGRQTELPASFRRPPSRFELGRLRRASLRAAYRYFSFADR